MDQYSWWGFGGGEGFCNKHSIPGKEIFPPHTRSPGPNFVPIVFIIIKDHLEEPTKSQSTFGLFTTIFSSLSNTSEAPTFQSLIHSLQSFSKMSHGMEGPSFVTRLHQHHSLFPGFLPKKKQLPLASKTNPELPTLSIEKIKE